MRERWPVLVGLLLGTSPEAFAAAPEVSPAAPRRSYVSGRARVAPRVDGRIDDAAIYFAFRAFDDPKGVAPLLSRRDRFPGDWVEVNIDSYADRRTAFSFTLSLSGSPRRAAGQVQQVVRAVIDFA